MHISFTAHQSSKGTSSFNLIDYLEKENQEQIGDIHDEKKQLDLEKKAKLEYFFDNDFSELNTTQKINLADVVNNIDNNRGTQNLKQSNFYMMNISPSKKELEHMSEIADNEIKKRGLDLYTKNEVTKLIVAEQKEELIKMQMKLYVKDVMNEYANNFNREIYVNENNIPNRKEKKEIEKLTEDKFSIFLKEKGIDVSDKKIVEKSSKWVEKNNIKIVEEKGKSLRVEIDLGEGNKSKVFMPKKLVQIQKNGNYKLPEDLYKEKYEEVVNKNTQIKIEGKNKNTNKLKDGSSVFTFDVNDVRFSEPLKLSFKESDLDIRRNTYTVSKHLLNQKKNKAIEQAIDENYGKVKEDIYKSLAEEKGFNLEKKKLTSNDMLWYGKIETQRTFKPTDKYVMENAAGRQEQSINGLHRDSKGNVIEKGMKKEGLQYHAHVVISRHDKTMLKPENKTSLSPLSNQKYGKIHNGASVGFERDVFYQKAETIFDKKFNYDREKEESYKGYKENKIKKTKALVKVKVKGQAISFLKKHTGVNKIKQQLSPIQNIKQQLGVAKIPTKIPTSVLEVAYKLGKYVVKKGLSY